VLAQVDSRYFNLRPLAAMRRFASRALFEGRPITTGGRWLNPFILALMRAENRLPQLRQVERPVFIVGVGRSGTFILGTILSLHRDVGYLSEPKALWHTIFPEEDVSGNYSDGPARYRLYAEDASENVRRAAHRLFGAYLTATFARRAIDKDQELIFRVPFVRAIFPNAQFVFLVRDGWNTCYSIGEWSKNHGRQVNGETHDWWGVNNRKWKLMLDQLVSGDPAFAGLVDVVKTFHSHIDMAAVEWTVTMREGLRQLEQHADCMYLLRYEALVADPQQELYKLLDFCQLPQDDKAIAYAQAVLVQKSPPPRFAVHEAIAPLFQDTLERLGYESELLGMRYGSAS